MSWTHVPRRRRLSSVQSRAVVAGALAAVGDLVEVEWARLSAASGSSAGGAGLVHPVGLVQPGRTGVSARTRRTGRRRRSSRAARRVAVRTSRSEFGLDRGLARRREASDRDDHKSARIFSSSPPAVQSSSVTVQVVEPQRALGESERRAEVEAHIGHACPGRASRRWSGSRSGDAHHLELVLPSRAGTTQPVRW